MLTCMILSITPYISYIYLSYYYYYILVYSHVYCTCDSMI